jgi:putative hydrolase of the HAD superfamily
VEAETSYIKVKKLKNTIHKSRYFYHTFAENMKTYKHLFFDLDRTLWDFEANSLITLQEIFDERKLKERGVSSFEDFLTFYKKYNHHLWDLYKLGEIKKDFLSVERFYGTLKNFEISDEELAINIAKDYVTLSPTKTKLFPDTINVLKKLSEKYHLHIITNGFSEVQFIKLKKSNLDIYFKQIITSEMVGVQKPNAKVFEFSLNKAGAKPTDSVMIGDDQAVDIIGAREFGIDQVFVDFNREQLICSPTWHVHQLKDLLKIF